MTRLAGLITLLVAGDVATTAYGLSLGAVEGNPLGPVLAIAVKVVGTIGIVLLLRLQQPRWRTLTALPALASLSLPVVWNTVQLAGVA